MANQVCILGSCKFYYTFWTWSMVANNFFSKYMLEWYFQSIRISRDMVPAVHIGTLEIELYSTTIQLDGMIQYTIGKFEKDNNKENDKKKRNSEKGESGINRVEWTEGNVREIAVVASLL